MADHWPVVRAIHAQGTATGNAPLPASRPPGRPRTPATCRRLVATGEAGTVLGWVALSPVAGRGVAAAARGRGVGSVLMQALMMKSEQNGLRMLQAGIFPESAASVRVHEAVGFRQAGRRERIGQLHGVAGVQHVDIAPRAVNLVHVLLQLLPAYRFDGY